MWFHLCTSNHDPVGRSTLIDMSDWFTAGLTDLGHKVTSSDTYVEPNAINIFWECFNRIFKSRISKIGVKYGIIATEIPDGHAFNWRDEPHWNERFKAFLKVAKGASFIWTMVEEAVPFYSKFCPTAFVELGWSEKLIPSYIDTQPIFDFSFFGLSTPYRVKIISQIRRYAHVEWPERMLTATEVGELIAHTRVGLSFKQSELWPIPSPTRLGRFIMAKRDIASEYTRVSTRQGDIVGLAPAGQDFIQFSLERLNSNWMERAERTYEEYRERMPMCDIMEEALEKTVTHVVIPGRYRDPVDVSSFNIPKTPIRSVIKSKFYRLCKW